MTDRRKTDLITPPQQIFNLKDEEKVNKIILFEIALKAGCQASYLVLLAWVRVSYLLTFKLSYGKSIALLGDMPRLAIVI